jgi:hypothetical protein
MADGAPDDAAQDVAAPFVAGNDAIGDQERTGADMVGQHAQRGAIEVGIAGFAGRCRDQAPE